MENVAGEQDLDLQQHFPYKTSKFAKRPITPLGWSEAFHLACEPYAIEWSDKVFEQASFEVEVVYRNKPA